MKIVHIYPSLRGNADGVAAVIRSLASEQISRNEQVYLGPYALTTEETLNTTKITWFDVLRATITRVFLYLKINKDSLVSIDHTVFHVHGLWSIKSIILTMVMRRHGDALVLSPHGMLSEYSLRRSFVKKLIFRKLMQDKFISLASVIVATSHDELEASIKFSHSSKVVLQPHGVDDLGHCLPKPIEGKRTILHFGRVDPKKNTMLLVQAWQKIAVFFPEHQLSIVGDVSSPYAKLCRDYCAQNNVPRVKFFPPVKYRNRFSVFASAIVTVLASENENFGLVIAESLAAGVPVIVSKNMPWLGVSDKSCGWVTELNETDLSKVLFKALRTDPKELNAMGKRGSKWMMDDYSWKTVDDKLSKIYTHALDIS